MSPIGCSPFGVLGAYIPVTCAHEHTWPLPTSQEWTDSGDELHPYDTLPVLDVCSARKTRKDTDY